MSGRYLHVVVAAMSVLVAVTLVELVANVTILGEERYLLVGLVFVAWFLPQARSATGADRTLAGLGVLAGLLLAAGTVGGLLA